MFNCKQVCLGCVDPRCPALWLAAFGSPEAEFASFVQTLFKHLQRKALSRAQLDRLGFGERTLKEQSDSLEGLVDWLVGVFI